MMAHAGAANEGGAGEGVSKTRAIYKRGRGGDKDFGMVRENKGA